MGKYTLGDWGHLAAKYLLSEIKSGVLRPPCSISMKMIADEVGTTPQNIGMAFGHVSRVMISSGYSAKAFAKSPRRVEIKHYSPS